MKMEFHGGKELEAALQELKLSTRKSIARRVMKKALKPFIERVQVLAPKRSSIMSKSYGITSKLAPREKKKEGKLPESMVVMRAGTAVSRAVLQEFGTVRQEARPHARPAWDETKHQVFDIVRTEMAVEVEKSVARARRKAARAAK
ncbi:HK97-gp10 family putative phage morphogenesis protein [Celeribacter halophilus]|uniref:HK97-gp10 family putative phage morphogenesis protein n=1 Tax=Celeribacter halophilus TaxID=576117 RepID=UPI003A91C9B2